MRLYITAFLVILMFCRVEAQPMVLSLDSCRIMAIRNNRQMQIQGLRIKSSEYREKEAIAAYLPSVDFNGGYVYNQKNLAIFDSDQLLPTKTFNAETGKYEFNFVTNPATGEPIKTSDGQYVPSTVALIPKETMTYDVHNIFFGAITVTQPIYMGGKIIAMNRISHYASDLAKAMQNIEAENLIYAVDATYWQIVSLNAKFLLAKSYVNLLDTLRNNVQIMCHEGVATKGDLLNVGVKLNQAQVDLVKVENGLALSRMSLAQICGLPLNEPITLADELKSYLDMGNMVASNYDMSDVYARRNDVRALELNIKIKEQEQRVAMSSMLPNIAVVGSYAFSNPNMYDGFKKHFDGALSIGAMVSIPIWHWGGNYNKYRVAKTEVVISRLALADAQDKIELQVRQAIFKAQESQKTYNMTESNLANADENLRMAQVGFKEGILTIDNVMEAQTAWLKANSEKIDAEIDVKMCNVYLSKVLGTLLY